MRGRTMRHTSAAAVLRLVPPVLAGAAALVILAAVAWVVLTRQAKNSPEPVASAHPETREPRPVTSTRPETIEPQRAARVADSAPPFAPPFYVSAALPAPAAEQPEPPAKAPEPPAKLQPRMYFSPGEEVEGRTLAEWAERLRNPDDSVREKAISIIPLYGHAASHLVPDLVECLDPKKPLGEDLGPRVKAIMALGVMEIQSEHVPKVVLALAKVLREDPQHAAKLQAALTLTRFGPEDAGRDARKEAVAALAGGANDRGSWQIRKASILALRRLGSDAKRGPEPVATRALLQLVRYEKIYYVKLEAIQALGYMDKPPDAALHQSVLEALRVVTGDRSSGGKVMSMWAYVSLMALDKVTDEGIKHITKNLDSTVLEERGQAVLALGTLGMKAKPAVPDLVRMLQDKDNGIVIAACWALVSVGERDAKALAAMEELSKRKDLDERVREQVLRALDELKNRPKSELFPSVKDEPKKDKEKEPARRETPRP